jgi:hypothetical protein
MVVEVIGQGQILGIVSRLRRWSRTPGVIVSRAFDPMHESPVVCKVIRAGHGVERTQSRQTYFSVGEGRSSGHAASQRAHLCGSLHRWLLLRLLG